jgi:hypothetical protein
MTQRVISVISDRGTDVRFAPNSDRESDRPYAAVRQTAALVVLGREP